MQGLHIMKRSSGPGHATLSLKSNLSKQRTTDSLMLSYWSYENSIYTFLFVQVEDSKNRSPRQHLNTRFRP